VINPQRNKGEPHLPPWGILAVNPSDSGHFVQLAQQYTLKRHFLFHAQLLSNETLFVAGPAVGAPMAVLCLEKLIALGAQQVLVYGWCGAVTADLRVGDVFLPTSGLSEEGTSRHYPVPATEHQPAPFHPLLVAGLERQGYGPQQGTIWTTDAVYRETRDKVERYGARGVMAVDMEYTALKAVAAFRQIQLAAVMLVSDELYHHHWVPRFPHPPFRTASRQLLAQLCGLLQSGAMQ
jgi:uridine phosphorylase